MKTEFNVERVCERVHMCVVEAPDSLGLALIEVKAGSIHVSFPDALYRYRNADGSEYNAKPSEVVNAAVAESNAQNAPEAGAIAKPKRRGK